MENQLENQLLDVVKNNLNTVQFEAVKTLMSEHTILKAKVIELENNLNITTELKNKFYKESRDLELKLQLKAELDTRDTQLKIKEEVLKAKEEFIGIRIGDYKSIVECIFKNPTKITQIREAGNVPVGVDQYGNSRSAFSDNSKTIEESQK